MPKLPSLIPQYMRAIVLPAPSQSPQALQLRSVPVDMPTGRQILVKVAACAVAYRDILDRKGAFPFIKRPTVLGHEFAGVVAAAGPDAHEFHVGQRVVSLHWAQRDAWPSPLQVSQSALLQLGCACALRPQAAPDTGQRRRLINAWSHVQRRLRGVLHSGRECVCRRPFRLERC